MVVLMDNSGYFDQQKCSEYKWILLYLEGATPTRFGPSPRKSDLGPSFSRIDLKNFKKEEKKQNIKHIELFDY